MTVDIATLRKQHPTWKQPSVEECKREFVKYLSGPNSALWALGPYALTLLSQLEAAQARIAELESKQEPVPIYQYEHSIYNENNGDTEWLWADCDKGFYEQYSPECRRILYTTPPKPVVVPEMQQLKEAVNFYLQVQKENPPVEQGMHKDADEWIKRAAIEAAGIVINGGE